MKKLLIKLTISSSLIAFIVSKVDKEQLFTNIKLMRLEWIPFIIILIVLNYIVSSMRWKKLLLDGNEKKVSLGYLTSVYFEGAFFNNFMPTSIGGDVYKVVKLGKKIGSNSAAFASTFMERFTGVLLLLLISLIGFAGYIKWWTLAVVLWIALAAYFGIKIFKFLAKKSTKIHKIYLALSKYKNNYPVLAYAAVTSLAVQIFSVLTQYVIYVSLGQHIPFEYALFVFPLITLAGFIIPSLNGIGVQDALFVAMFSAVGVPPAISLSASILYHLFRLGVSLIGGVLYAVGKSD